ncbi:DUF6544 family protein [Variovorax sp. H27-G14]|uniref:DUF6920 family protein n=1 Tax=Variovorax sp. H27-G14 TaxID=3111914 RepID=UPI0038FC2E89
MKRAVALFAGVAAAATSALAFGAWRWRRSHAAFRAKMLAARRPMAVKVYNAVETEALPPPVRRYFRAVLQEGQAMVSGVRLSQRGRFRQSLASDTWQPLRATQRVTTHPPGFGWDARIRLALGVRVFVRDAYVLGTGSLRACVLGLVTVADLHDTPEIARGELMRYLAEAVWYPTALLPSQGVRWEAIDDTSSRATLTDGATTVCLEFRFRADGLVAAVWAASRPRSATESAPWLCRLDSYERRAGMCVPLFAEVEWQLPAGPAPYFQGRLTGIVYEFDAR